MKAYFKKQFPLIFRWRLACILVAGFVAFTVIGTLTHELGHIAFAKAFGYRTSLHYGYMQYHEHPLHAEYYVIDRKYTEAIQANEPFSEWQRKEELEQIFKTYSLWITMGGPIQTIITGSLGFIFLYRKRKRIVQRGMQWVDWLLVFLSLFWLRELFNPITGLVRAIVQGTYNPFSGRSDELSLARDLGWWEGSISMPLALIAAFIGVYVIFKILPKTYRFTFILAGLVGGMFGFFFWLEWLGPVVMP